MKKVVICLIVVVVIALVAVGVIFGRQRLLVNKYSNIEKYELRNDSIPSVAKVVGSGTLKKVTTKKDRTNDIETLELVYEDSNAKASSEKYIEYLKENDNYLDTKAENDNIRRIAETSSNSDDLITVETELTENGYIVRIEVGKGFLGLEEQD